MSDPRTRLAGDAREAAIKLAAEVELTVRLVSQIPSSPPTLEGLEDLRRVLEFRGGAVDREVHALQANVQAIINFELLAAERLYNGDPRGS